MGLWNKVETYSEVIHANNGKMRIAVIGAGISGLSIAQLLKDDYDVTVFEQNRSVGGLIKCKRVNDCLYHTVGGHVFNSKNQQVLNWFWSFFNREEEFTETKRKAKVYFQDQIIGYPIENHIYNLDKPLINSITKELLELQKTQKHKTPCDYSNFEEFLKENFGDTLYRIYFKPYNTKIWKTDLKQVSMQWLEGKLPMPDYSEIILSNILREEENRMVHATFFYPKYNGSQFIADRLSKELDIKTGFTLNDASLNGHHVLNRQHAVDKVIYTGDIRRLPNQWQEILSANDIDMQQINSLHANGTSTVFCETDETDISWLYFPENFTTAHRIIYTGNFSDTNNNGSDRKTCVVEFSGKVPNEEMAAQLLLLPGNLVPLSYNYEPNSYVVQTHGTRQLIEAVKKVLMAHNIYLLGRFAEWEYYNMDKAMESAFRLAEVIKAS